MVGKKGSPRVAYLLDTNICIWAMRGTASVIAAISARDPVEVMVSSVTSYELFTGIEKCANPKRERGKVETLLNMLAQLDFDLAAAKESARIRAELESRGETIGPYDVLLAGQALSRGLTLVTGNTGEFRRVAGLALEDWHTTVPDF